MARNVNRLTDAACKGATAAMNPDGLGLYLQVKGGKSWVLRYQVAGKAHYLGLGPYPDVSLKAARDLADQARAGLRAGIAPIAAKRAKKAAEAIVKARGITFAEAARQLIDARKAGWRNGKHAAQWAATLTTYAFPTLGNVAVADVDTSAVLGVLEPIWKAGKIETGVRVRGRIESVLDYAAVKGWREKGFNPATWKGHLSHTLAKPGDVRRVIHHPALPWQQAPAFMSALAGRDGVAALAVRFAILTAARSGEVRGATWAEIDMAAKVWAVPPERMKSRREHRVPLSDAALAVLDAARPPENAGDDALVFPGLVKGRPLSDMSLTAVLRRMGRADLTVHGFRSSFRDWASETGQPADLAEASLAHTLGNKVQAAYQRGDLLDRRRALMTAWAAFCTPPAIGAANHSTTGKD